MYSTHNNQNQLSGIDPVRTALGMLSSRILGRHKPLFVNIEPTHVCNLSCTFCDKHEGPQMSTEDGVRLLHELAAMGTVSVCFDGGEPLAHPGIGELVQTGRRLGLAISISTNGILIPRRIDRIAEANVVKISIDGPEEIHDRGRGSGNFRRALEGARVAQARGIWVALRMTLAEHNVRAHRAVLRIAEELGVQALFQPAIGSLFDASKHQASHSPHVTAYRETIDDLIELKKRGAPVANELVALRHLRKWPEPNPVPFCGGGRVMAAIGPEGGIYPCGRVGRGQPAPNAIDAGVARAFEDVLRPTDCASCWCTLTLSNCYAYRLDPRLLEGRLLSPFLSTDWDATLAAEADPKAETDAAGLVQLRRKRPSGETVP
ncbi:radical SAM/SPASM domain-containing protein [Polyangium sp. 6x1]|uniref:radical SAM protein n=1 Tax=Polyangium sp. 6x1 TaxID=3042689 RepID=UPI0024822E33|nr:radical SAM/SPASM domain-containing protein [Polyangium sp. 6x1]MDI1444349.1 radical SAM/SPASM domain-containing protein [Polyangium sp. 6x1]